MDKATAIALLRILASWALDPRRQARLQTLERMISQGRNPTPADFAGLEADLDAVSDDFDRFLDEHAAPPVDAPDPQADQD